jgi:hypothetical protein
MEEKQFVGARRANSWYCCVCFDILFGVDATNIITDYGSYQRFRPVYRTDEWVQDKACFFCEERFDQE